MPDDEPTMIMPPWPQSDTPLVWPRSHGSQGTLPDVDGLHVRHHCVIDAWRPDTWPAHHFGRWMRRRRALLVEEAAGKSMPPEWSDERKALHSRWARLELGLEVGEIAAHAGAAKGPPFTPGQVHYLRFSKGEPVPEWLESTSIPGVFEVDVECVVGSIERLRRLYPDLFLPKAWPGEPDRSSSYMAPTRPLRPGEGLIRYAGAAALFEADRDILADLRVGRIGFRTGGRDSILWRWDGDDLLFMAHWAGRSTGMKASGDPLPRQPDDPVVASGTIHELRFAEGEWLPNWLADLRRPAVFGVDARCLVGSPDTLLGRYPSLFARDAVPETYQGNISYFSPIDPLEPGEYLIRHPGGEGLPSMDPLICVFLGGGGPDRGEWLKDGMPMVRPALR